MARQVECLGPAIHEVRGRVLRCVVPGNLRLEARARGGGRTAGSLEARTEDDTPAPRNGVKRPGGTRRPPPPALADARPDRRHSFADSLLPPRGRGSLSRSRFQPVKDRGPHRGHTTPTSVAVRRNVSRSPARLADQHSLDSQETSRGAPRIRAQRYGRIRPIAKLSHWYQTPTRKFADGRTRDPEKR